MSRFAVGFIVAVEVTIVIFGLELSYLQSGLRNDAYFLLSFFFGDAYLFPARFSNFEKLLFGDFWDLIGVDISFRCNTSFFTARTVCLVPSQAIFCLSSNFLSGDFFDFFHENLYNWLNVPRTRFHRLLLGRILCRATGDRSLSCHNYMVRNYLIFVLAIVNKSPLRCFRHSFL